MVLPECTKGDTRGGACQWPSLTQSERAEVVAAVPGEVTDAEALLLESDELIARLEHMLDEVQQRAEDVRQRAEEETRRREGAERELIEVREELARLKARR